MRKKAWPSVSGFRFLRFRVLGFRVVGFEGFRGLGCRTLKGVNRLILGLLGLYRGYWGCIGVIGAI